MVGGRVGRYLRVELTQIWSFLFFSSPSPRSLHSNKIRLHINATFSDPSFQHVREETATALPLSVVLERLRLDAAARRLLRLAAQDRVGVADRLLVQDDRFLGVGQNAVRDGLFLEGW